MSYYGSLGRRRALMSAGLVALQALDYLDNVFDPEDASVGFTVANTGIFHNDGALPATYNWLLSGVASGYELRADLVSGDTPSGSLGTWLNLATNRTYTLSRTTLGSKACTLDLSIRRTSDSFVLATARQTMEATVEI
jgi:hypothetical protein